MSSQVPQYVTVSAQAAEHRKQQPRVVKLEDRKSVADVKVQLEQLRRGMLSHVREVEKLIQGLG